MSSYFFDDVFLDSGYTRTENRKIFGGVGGGGGGTDAILVMAETF